MASASGNVGTMKAVAILLALSATASAETLAPQVQADLGLSVVMAAYERPVADHVAVAVGGGIFGTYFLPWFDRGDDVKGLGLETRVTWFHRSDGHGLYVAPYVRALAVRGDVANGMTADGYAVTSGVFVGWIFGLTDRLDLRLGGGAQYIFIDADPLGASTPFLAADILVGYRFE